MPFEGLFLLSQMGYGAPVRVEAIDGAPVLVTVDGAPAVALPQHLDLQGRHRLGFRSTAFGSDLFFEEIDVPETGLQVGVDIRSRRATASAPAPAPPAKPTPVSAIPEPATAATDPAPAAAPPPAPPAPPTPSGDLFVQADQAGAAIWIDGSDTGLVTPGMVRGLSLGVHAAEVRTECARATGQVTVLADRISRLDDLLLVVGPGTVHVDADPPGATVYVDSTEVGKAPFVGQIACGDHRIEVRAEGRLTQSTVLHVLGYFDSTWIATLPMETYGTLVLDLVPLDAKATVDGTALPAGPATLDPIATGEHLVSVEAPGFEPHQEMVTVVTDAVSRVSVTLAPVAAPEPTRTTPWGRVALDGGVTVAGLGLGTLALIEYVGARSAFQEYLAEPNDAAAEQIYSSEVAPRRTVALLAAIGGGVALAGSGALWFTTDFTAGGPRLAVGGRW